MQVSTRTKFSLAQLLSVVGQPTVNVIFKKYGFDPQLTTTPEGISGEVNSAEDGVLSDLLVEVIQTNRTLRYQTSPKYMFDEHYSITKKSLLLDGYLVEETSIKALDPTAERHEPVEDALLDELDNSTLHDKVGIIRAIKYSANDFINVQPDYNGSLTNIRIALETLVREIASDNGFTTTRTGNTWGPSLGHLRTCGFIDQKEENTLSSVFTFVSNGAHIPLGFNHAEIVRLGRNMCSSMCYFLVKKYNA